MHAYFIWETRASKAYATSALKYTQGLATSDASASYSSGKLHLPVKETPVLNAALIYISPIFFLLTCSSLLPMQYPPQAVYSAINEQSQDQSVYFTTSKLELRLLLNFHCLKNYDCCVLLPRTTENTANYGTYNVWFYLVPGNRQVSYL